MVIKIALIVMYILTFYLLIAFIRTIFNAVYATKNKHIFVLRDWVLNPKYIFQFSQKSYLKNYELNLENNKRIAIEDMKSHLTYYSKNYKDLYPQYKDLWNEIDKL